MQMTFCDVSSSASYQITASSGAFLMKPYIQITRHLYEEPYHLNLVILASNGLMTGALEFYTNPNKMNEVGLALEGFPRYQGDKHIWELGSEADWKRRAGYFLLRAYCMRKSGQCLFHLRFNNNMKPHDKPMHPDPAVSEFCIRTTVERIQKFGGLLREFAKLEHQRLYWTNDDAILDNELENKGERTGNTVRSAMASLQGCTLEDIDPLVRF